MLIRVEAPAARITAPTLNELGARGIGEIGLAGVTAAITAAVHHATGVRVRELPVKIEDLLTSSVLS
jgi:xanthine dehydrogenase YagR molybdenum-binding subunit